MEHPRERSGLTRRRLLRRAAGSAVGLSAAGFLAGCENTTEPIGNAGGPTGAAAKLVVQKPTGPGGLPLPRPDNAVTWAITPENRRSPTAARPKGVRSTSTTTPTISTRSPSRSSRSCSTPRSPSPPTTPPDEAIAKLASGAVGFDVILGLTGSNIVNLIAQSLLQPLNHSYLPNLAKNIWPELQDPFYDRGSRYTVPYVVWMDGIGWRNDHDQDRHRRDGRPMGHLLALPALPRPRRRARRQARRAQHADAARRDARRRAPRPQHRGRCADRQGRAASSPS